MNESHDLDSLKMPTGGLFPFGHVVMLPEVPVRLNGWQIVDFLKIHGQGGDDANRPINLKAIDTNEPVVSTFKVSGDTLVIRTDGNRAKTRIFFAKGYAS